MQEAILDLQTPMLDRLLNQATNDAESLAFEGLLEIPEGARLERFDRILGRVVAGHHDTRQLGLDVANLSDQFEAVDARHLDVAQHQVHADGGHLLQGFRCVPGHHDVVADACENAFDGSAIELLVVDDEDFRFLHRRCGSAQRRGLSQCRRCTLGRPSAASWMTHGTGLATFRGPTPNDPDRCLLLVRVGKSWYALV